MRERISPILKEQDPYRKLETRLFNSILPSPLILGSGSLIEQFEEIEPYLLAGAGAVVPRTTRKVMERSHHPSPHLYQAGRKGEEMMLNAEWTGADVTYWRPYLENMASTEQVVMSVSGRDISGCAQVCKELDGFNFPYLEVNISCAHSNSQHGFITRNGQHIRDLVSAIKEAGVTSPIAIKLGHSDFIVDLANIAKEAGADGIVAVNTFGPLFDFDIDDKGNPSRVLGISGGKGGMSGAPLFQIALTDIAEISHHVGIPVIGCGGVRTAEHVTKMMMAGASAVQIYTAAHVRGVMATTTFTEVNGKLVKYFDQIGVNKATDIVGRAVGLLEEPTNMEPLIPTVSPEKCTGCDICVPVCLPLAINKEEFPNKRDHIIAINKDACVGCGHCVTVCPTNALSVNLNDHLGNT